MRIARCVRTVHSNSLGKLEVMETESEVPLWRFAVREISSRSSRGNGGSGARETSHGPGSDQGFCGMFSPCCQSEYSSCTCKLHKFVRKKNLHPRCGTCARHFWIFWYNSFRNGREMSFPVSFPSELSELDGNNLRGPLVSGHPL